MSLQDKIEVIVAEWKVERDLKCVDCSRGLALGRHGCHWEDDAEESYAVGNCKAWPLSRRIKQLEEALAATQQAIAANEAANRHVGRAERAVGEKA